MVDFDFWACQRPLTHHWGSGDVFTRIEKNLGKIDVAFGKQDQIPDTCFAVDKNNGYDWIKLPFKDNQFEFGYWDPPYDKMYKHEGIEIWRCCKKLAILHKMIRICSHCGLIHQAWNYWFERNVCPECGIQSWFISINIGDGLKIHVGG